jgi:hypothetical protein
VAVNLRTHGIRIQGNFYLRYPFNRRIMRVKKRRCAYVRKQVHVKINGVEIAPKQVMCTGEDIHAMQRCLGAADAHVDWDMVCGKTVSSLAVVTMASVAAGLCHKAGIGASLLFCCTMALHYSLFGKKLKLRKRATAATHALDALVPCFKRNRARAFWPCLMWAPARPQTSSGHWRDAKKKQGVSMTS